MVSAWATGKMEKYDMPMHIVSAHIAELGVTSGQQTVYEKSNEIPAVRKLIGLLKIEGCIVVADALNCQKEKAKVMMSGKADYLLSVKGNQETLNQKTPDSQPKKARQISGITTSQAASLPLSSFFSMLVRNGLLNPCIGCSTSILVRIFAVLKMKMFNSIKLYISKSASKNLCQRLCLIAYLNLFLFRLFLIFLKIDFYEYIEETLVITRKS